MKFSDIELTLLAHIWNAPNLVSKIDKSRISPKLLESIEIITSLPKKFPLDSKISDYDRLKSTIDSKSICILLRSLIYFLTRQRKHSFSRTL